MADVLLELGGRRCGPGRFWRKRHMRFGRPVKGTCVLKRKKRRR